MTVAAKDIQDRITKVSNAWEQLAKTETFAGMTLEQFNAKVQPSLDLRDQIAKVESQLSALKDQRDDADQASIETIQLVVNSVKGSPNHGEDSDLYETMGYVRKSERQSGLHRGANAAQSAPNQAAKP